MLQSLKKLPHKPEGMRDCFFSYHFVGHKVLDNGTMPNGFGNYVGRFNVEVYHDNLGKFILDAEKSISMVLEEQFKMKVTVKVINFK